MSQFFPSILYIVFEHVIWLLREMNIMNIKRNLLKWMTLNKQAHIKTILSDNAYKWHYQGKCSSFYGENVNQNNLQKLHQSNSIYVLYCPCLCPCIVLNASERERKGLGRESLWTCFERSLLLFCFCWYFGVLCAMRCPLPGNALRSQSAFKTSNDVVAQTPNALDFCIYKWRHRVLIFYTAV